MFDNKGLIFVIFGIIFLGVCVALFERRKFSSKEICLIAVLAGIAALGRVPLAAIPSAQATTFMVIIAGYVFGSTSGFMVGLLAAFISNFFLGQGPWTLIQMLCWGICGISAGILGKMFREPNKLVLVIFGVIWGILFGWMTNLWYWLSFVYPLNMSTWIVTNIASIWFDITHALTNAFFLYFLGEDFIRILERFKVKLSFSRTFKIVSSKV